MMRLPTFIIDNIDRIIADWKGAALPAMLPFEGQAKQILMAVAADIESNADRAASSAAVTVRTVLRTTPDFDVQRVGEALHLLRAVVPAVWNPAERRDMRSMNGSVSTQRSTSQLAR
jgi:hypothetical protein